jgi:hypothetical protein
MDARNEEEAALEVPKDCFDRDIKIGDICVYPVRRGSKMWMNRIVVQKISHDPQGRPKLHGVKGDGWTVNITSLDRVALIGRNNVIPFSE